MDSTTLDQLERLAALKLQGHLSEAEYQSEKSRLLQSASQARLSDRTASEVPEVANHVPQPMREDLDERWNKQGLLIVLAIGTVVACALMWWLMTAPEPSQPADGSKISEGVEASDTPQREPQQTRPASASTADSQVGQSGEPLTTGDVVGNAGYNSYTTGPRITFSNPDRIGGIVGATAYTEVRRRLISQGFQPLPTPENDGCRDLDCKTYPEIGDCAGTGDGQCFYSFRSPEGRPVDIGSVGGPPPDAIVTDLSYGAANPRGEQ